jgi:TPR repeat protein
VKTGKANWDLRCPFLVKKLSRRRSAAFIFNKPTVARPTGRGYASAREWYQKAADAGNTDGMNNLGLLYENGRGVVQDYAKTRER